MILYLKYLLLPEILKLTQRFENDENGVIPISIDCRGPERDKAKQNIQGKTAERFLDEIENERQRNLTLNDIRNAGNSSNFMSFEAAKKLKQEQMGQEDKHKNPWISLKLSHIYLNKRSKIMN
jgi:hypothetical protein